MDGVPGWSSRLTRGFCLAATALLLVAWCARPDAQPDLYFHLACARWIVEHGFPRHDVFLQGGLERAFVDPEWAFQLGVAALEWAGGPRLLGLVKTSVVLLFACLALRPVPGIARWALAIPFVLLAGPRFVIRPELVTYAVVAWQLGWRRAPEGRALLAAAAAQVLWANAHGFALLGPALLGVRAGVALVAGRPWRGWARVGVVLLGCCALTPYPVGTLAYLPRIALETVGAERLPIAELAAPWSAGWSDPMWLLVVSWTAASLPLAWLGWRAGRLQPDRAGAALALLLLGAPYTRTLPLVALALVTLCGPGLALLARALRGRRQDPAWVALGAVAFLLARATVDDRFHANPQFDAPAGWGRVEFKAYPEALAGWAEDPPPAPLFNGFSAGHYLLYAGQRPFICGNLDLYPRSHFAAYRALLDGDPRELGARLSAGGFRSAFLDPREHSPLLLEALARDPAWSLRFVGPKAWVFERRPRQTPPVRREPPFPDEVRQGSVLRALTLLPARGLHPRSRLHLAQALPALGEAPRALELVRGALELAPRDPVVLGAAAELERLAGDPERAQALVRRWVALEPSAQAHLARGAVAMRHGDPRGALEAYRAALDAGPDPETALRARVNLLAAAEAAEDPLALRRAVARFGDELEPALACFYRGNAARLEADYPTAERWLLASTEADPGLAAAWARLGEVRFLAGAYAEAVQAYRRLVERAPDAANWRDLGVALERAGDPRGALEAWRHAVSVDPGEVTALTYAARLHAAAGRRDDALEALREALARDPKHPTARRMLLQLRGGG